MNKISKKEKDIILQHFFSIPFWSKYWDKSAVILVGSKSADFGDNISDIDIVAIVEKSKYKIIYNEYKKAMLKKEVKVINPEAFKYNEFPCDEILNNKIKIITPYQKWIVKWAIELAQYLNL